MDSNAVLSVLSERSDLDDIAEIRVFTAQRETAEGDRSEEVTIRVYDYGHGFPAGRYRAVVTTEDGREATGNRSDSVEVVLRSLHFGELDG